MITLMAQAGSFVPADYALVESPIAS
ncbi:hypothetical protein, partial [Novipirellula maiorica]